MFFAKLFQRSDPVEAAARQLYGAVVAKARDPAFYATLSVPDTVNGRFDMMVIHAMLVLRRLRGGGAAADRTGKALLELLFKDMDQSLREMGVGDMGIGRHIKRMAKALFGRAQAYEAGLGGDLALLKAALIENLYRSATPRPDDADRMAEYMRRAAAHAEPQAVAAILAGQIDLGTPVVAEAPTPGGSHGG